jgi:hypothetical protein
MFYLVLYVWVGKSVSVLIIKESTWGEVWKGGIILSFWTGFNRKLEPKLVLPMVENKGDYQVMMFMWLCPHSQIQGRGLLGLTRASLS